ncbi:MAG: hypothetical protein FJX59_19085 [Alphaproteobacteria bacterium]|nr:hypothetical protein [Alphaproteobacteria bacterium]
MLHRRALFAAPLFAAASAWAQQPPLQIDVSVHFDSATLLWVPFRAPGLPAGMMLRPLRRIDDGGLRSAVVRMAAGYTSGGRRRIRNRIQIYVLSGEVAIGDLKLRRASYACLQPGSNLPSIGSPVGAEFLIICDGAPAFEAVTGGKDLEGAVINERVNTDTTVRLWEDPVSGANTSHIRVPSGWTSPGPEYHPCQEEIFCITGDIAPDDIRILKPGWFLWNPPYGVHGFRLFSTAGGTVLEWHDAKWAKLIYEGPV